MTRSEHDTARDPAAGDHTAGDRAAEQGAASANETLGAILRRLRKARGWTLHELAQASGVSLGMISQVERDLVNPSVRVLTAIRRSLGAPVWAVFRDVAPSGADAPADPDFVRRADRRPFLEMDTLRNELLTATGHHDLQMMILHINPDGHSGNAAMSYPAEKGGMVLSGELLLTVDGRQALLKQGDSFVFDGMLEHGFSNPSRQPAQVMWIIGAVRFDRHL